MVFNTENTMEPIYLHALKMVKDCLKLSSTVDDIIVESVVEHNSGGQPKELFGTIGEYKLICEYMYYNQKCM